MSDDNTNPIYEFCSDKFNEHYPKDSMPSWVDYEKFKKEMVEKMVLCLKSNKDQTETTWNSDFYIALASCHYDPSASGNWDYFDEMEETIPKNVQDAL